MLKTLAVLEVIKEERKYLLSLPDQAQASEILQVLSEMFAFISNAIQANMKAQTENKTSSEPVEQPKEGEHGQ